MKFKLFEKKVTDRLEQLGIEYEKIDLSDDDINFYLNIDGKQFIKELKTIGKIGTLMYIDVEAETLNIFCTNIYRDCNKDSLLKAINVVNRVNSRITYGKVFVDRDGKIIYQNAVPISESIDVEKYIRAFVLTIWIFYCEMKKIEESNEK